LGDNVRRSTFSCISTVAGAASPYPRDGRAISQSIIGKKCANRWMPPKAVCRDTLIGGAIGAVERDWGCSIRFLDDKDVNIIRRRSRRQGCETKKWSLRVLTVAARRAAAAKRTLSVAG